MRNAITSVTLNHGCQLPRPIRSLYPRDGLPGGIVRDGFKALEDLGYGAIWITGNAPGDLKIAETVLSETQSVVVGTAIINVWMEPVDKVAASFHRVEGEYPGRLVLGVGIGHREMNGDVYQKPLQTLSGYVDRLADLGVPADRIILAALRSRFLQLARAETAGALAYFTTVEHTKKARSILGSDRILSVVQAVPTGAERTANLSIARRYSKLFLGLQSYVNNLNEGGYPHLKVGDSPDESLLEAIVPLGCRQAVVARIHEHVEAGADHVPILPIPFSNNALGSAARSGDSFGHAA